MIVCGACLGAACAAIVCGPVVCRPRSWAVGHPRAALRAWLVLFVAGLALLVISGISALGAAVAASPSHPDAALAATVAGYAMLVAFGALTSLAGTRVGPIHRSASSLRWHLEFLAARSGDHRHLAGVEVIVLDAGTSTVTALQRGRIVVSRRLWQSLDAGAQRAIVEHERAHWQGHHQLVLWVARLNVACFPWMHAAREFDCATRILVELVADDVAAERCGHGPLLEALEVLSGLESDAAASLRGRRLRRLAPVPHNPAGPGRDGGPELAQP